MRIMDMALMVMEAIRRKIIPLGRIIQNTIFKQRKMQVLNWGQLMDNHEHCLL